MQLIVALSPHISDNMPPMRCVSPFSTLSLSPCFSLSAQRTRANVTNENRDPHSARLSYETVTYTNKYMEIQGVAVSG